MSEHEPLPEGKEPPPRGVHAMAIVRWLIVIAMAAVAALAIVHGYGIGKHSHESTAGEVWYCPMHPSVVSDRPGECPICGMALVKRDQAGDAGEKDAQHTYRSVPTDPYACPMHPEVTGLSPDDRCPICHMKLEPRSTIDAGPDTGAIDAPVPGLSPLDLSLDRVQLIGMKTAKATRESLVPELKTVGTIAAPEQGLAKVTTRYSGFVEGVTVGETGRKVKRGELLASVYSPQVYLAEQEYLTARGFGAAQGPHEGDLAGNARKRLELLGVSAGEIAAIEKAGKPSRTIGVFAPASGYIVQKNAVLGLSFQAGTDLYTIADLSRVWVIADVYEAELSRVAVGRQAKLMMLAYPDRSWVGEVKLVYPNIDPATRTAKVRLEFKNEALDLKPGMYGDVAIAMPESTAIVVPREALVDTGELQYVFVDKGHGRFEPRRVTVGVRAGEKVEIRSGVAEGETVVTTGNFLLDSESRLRAAIEGK